MALAERTGGIIINADSAQIYRDLPVLSAAPSEEDRARTEHRLYGTGDGALPCSAADWAALAKAEIERAREKNRLPILVGGSGLYLRTLLDGIAPVPPIDPTLRAAIRTRTVEANRAELEQLDPEAAAGLNPSDKTRVARALEVVRSSGQTLADWQAKKVGGIGGNVDLRPLILLPPRDWVHARCDARFAAMIDAGAVEEVKRLLARGLDPDLPVMRVIGVPEIAAFLRGQIDEAAMLAAGARATRRYAKRQYTWFTRQPPADWPRFTDPLEGNAIEPALALIAQRP